MHYSVEIKKIIKTCWSVARSQTELPANSILLTNQSVTQLITLFVRHVIKTYYIKGVRALFIG